MISLVIRLLALFAATLSAFLPFAADASPFGQRRALLSVSGPGWDVEGVGRARNLRQLGAMLDANPTANVAQVGPYRAHETFRRNVVTADYSGTFDCKGYPVRGVAIVNSETLATMAAGTAVSFFKKIDGGKLRYCDIGGVVLQTGTSLDGTNQTYRVAGIAGFLNEAELTSVKGAFNVRVNGYFNYTSIIAAEIRGSTTFTDIDCSGSISLSLSANNNVVGCFAQFFGGTAPADPATLAGMRVHDLTIVAATGKSPGQTQNCSNAPNCDTTGGYIGAAIGAIGYGTDKCVVAYDITVESSVTTTNTTINGLGVTGGIGGNLFCGVLRDSSNAGTVTGANSTGGALGKIQITAGEAYNLVNTGTVNGTVSYIGGLVGTNAGYLHHSRNSGNIVAPTATSVGGLIGYHFDGGTANHLFGWGTLSAASVAGGAVGRVHANAGTLDQVYAMNAITGGSSIGGAIGVATILANVSNIYWNTTTSGYTQGVGNNASPGAAVTGLTDTQFLSGMPTNFDGDWAQSGGVAGGYPYLTALPTTPAPPSPVPRKFLTLAPSDSSPIDIAAAAVAKYGVSDFNCNNNVIRARGSGGNGGNSNTGSGAGGGGGGGAYAAILNYCPSGSVAFSVAAGGSGTGTNTWFDNVSLLKAASGANGGPATNGAGGSVNGGNSVGTVLKGGANGGSAGSGARSGGGGGGAGGPDGGGAVGGGGFGNSTQGGGGGGGGSNGGTAGSGGAAGVGGDGGRSFDPTPPVTASFTASMSGTTLSISAVSAGTPIAGQVVSGTSVPANTILLFLNSGSATDWTVSTSATIASESMTAATAAGYTPGGAGSTSTGTPGANGSNGSGAGGGSSSTSAASVGGAGSCTINGSGVASGSGGGGGGGLRVTLATGANGGAGGCSGGGGGGAGAGATNGATGGAGADGSIVIEWTPQ